MMYVVSRVSLAPYIVFWDWKWVLLIKFPEIIPKPYCSIIFQFDRYRWLLIMDNLLFKVHLVYMDT